MVFCWMFLLTTISISGYISTSLSLLGYNVWWLLMISPAETFGEMNISCTQLQLYCWLIFPLCIGLWNRTYGQILSSDNMWIKLAEISPGTNNCEYELYIIQVFFKSKSKKCQVVMAGTKLLLIMVSSLIRVLLGAATLGSRGL